ncbi:MAG: FtsX-like permease family protein [Cyclobacteriaceae bacterium]
MVRHYLKIAFRSLLNSRSYSVINILCLGVGIAASLLILQYIHFELSFDGFHPNSENTYRIRLDYQGSQPTRSEVLTPHALGSQAEQIIPEISNMVRVRPMRRDEGVVVKGGDDNGRKFLEYGLYYVDKNFLEMFGYSLKSGDARVALNDLNSIVITEEVAKKYFGVVDAMGKVLHVKGGSLSGEFVVSGVLNDLPANTHLQFDFLLPLQFMLSHYGIYARSDGWRWFNFYTYLTLDNNADVHVVQSKFDKLVQSNAISQLEEEHLHVKTGLQKITDIHLKSNFASDLAERPGNEQNLWFYALIAAIILLIAYMNFINLSTVQAFRREKEVGIRKSIGVNRNQIVTQFFAEAAIINSLAVFIGVVIAYLLVPFLNQLIGTELEFTILRSYEFILLFACFVSAGTILSGLYPALVLSSFNPVNIFHSVSQKFGGGIGLRKVLIGVQFSLSVLLIAGSYLVYKQINYMKSQDLGVDMDKIIVVPGPRVILEEENDQIVSGYQTFKARVKDHHAIKAVTGTSNIPGKGVMWYGDMRKLGAPAEFAKEGKTVLVDAGFTDTYDFDFLAGSGFTPEMDEYYAVIINEMALSTFQLGSPQEAIGQSIILSDIDTLKIQGVVKDVHWSSLKDPLSPTLFGVAQHNAYFSIRSSLTNIPQTLDHIETIFNESFPNDPFDYYFLDESFNQQYQSEIQFGKLFGAFTLLAIFLASIGLFALVSFTASLRTKEISLRKLFGASVDDIILLFSKEYLLLILIATIMATPVVIFGATTWLEGFAYRINLGIDAFLIPFSLLVVVSSLTIGHRIYLSAIQNPVDSLRR